MDLWESFLNWIVNLFSDVGNFQKFLTFSINIGGYNLNLFSVLTIGGLLAFLAVAVVKWVIS